MILTAFLECEYFVQSARLLETLTGGRYNTHPFSLSGGLALDLSVMHSFITSPSLSVHVNIRPNVFAARWSLYFHLYTSTCQTQDRFYTALICATVHGQTDCVRLLLENGSDMEAKDNVRVVKTQSLGLCTFDLLLAISIWLSVYLPFHISIALTLIGNFIRKLLEQFCFPFPSCWWVFAWLAARWSRYICVPHSGTQHINYSCRFWLSP
jgi:hypothetical protein